MKNTIKIIIFLFIIVAFSCSRDDDTAEPVKEYFPTKITTTFSLYPELNAITYIEYDDKNRISKFRYEKTNRIDSYEVIYDSNNLISFIRFTKVASGITTNKSLLFSYLNSYLQKMEIISSTDIQTINFNFNIATGIYITDRSTTDIFKIDENNNLIQYRFTGTEVKLTYNNNNGVYTNCNSLILLMSSCSSYTSDYFNTFYYPLFFSNKELITAYAGTFPTGSTYNLIATRASNNTISKIDYSNYYTGEIFSSSVIEY